MNFRYDINGLRAYAVIAVVIFHFTAQAMPGGFAGVDVFFVISGFLMTGILFRDFEKDRFSLVRFYISRANRIIPALAVLCAVLLVAGWVYLLPGEYETLGKHAAASVAFISNVVYWQESGYFDAASHQKWLLHTWSLAVEWQFYLLYPLVLLALKSLFSLAAVKRILVGLTAALFAYSVYISQHQPDAAYFLITTRAWEMLAGGLVCLYPAAVPQRLRRSALYAGIGMIIASYVVFDDTIAWPGYAALLPVAGTMLVIAANWQQSPLTRLTLFQVLGRWSYSIYLWHWPVAVIGYRYDIPYWWVPGMALSVLLGFLSYRYVESLRWPGFGSVIDIWRVRPAWMTAAVIAVGVGIMSYHGLAQRLTPTMQKAVASASSSPFRERCHIDDYQTPSLACTYGSTRAQWAVFGDSHTVELSYALAEQMAASGKGVRQYSFSGCAPSLLQENGSSRCTRWYKEVFKRLKNDDAITHVVMGHRYSWTLFGDHLASFPTIPKEDNPERTKRILASFDEAVNQLAETKQQVFVMLPVPELPDDVTMLLARAKAEDAPVRDIPGASLDYYERRNAVILNHLENASYPANVTFIDTRQAFCDDKMCHATQNGEALYFDSNHPSVVGAEKIATLITLADNSHSIQAGDR